MTEEVNERLTYMTDLQKLLHKLDGEGYTEQYKVENGLLHALSSHRQYQPHQVKAVNFYRFEGPSSADDMSICYVIETEDGLKGTLIDAYGVYADEELGEFMQSVEIFKKTQRSDESVSQMDAHQADPMMPEEFINASIDPASVTDPMISELDKGSVK